MQYALMLIGLGCLVQLAAWHARLNKLEAHDRYVKRMYKRLYDATPVWTLRDGKD